MTELETRATSAAMLAASAARATGCLLVTDMTGGSGRIYLRDGEVYSARVRGSLPRLAHRLRAGGMIDDEGLRDLLGQCGGDPHALDAGERAVASGLVDVEVLHALHRELLLSSIGVMRTWRRVRTEVRRGAETSLLTVPPIPVPTVLRALERRHERWEVLWAGLAAGAPVHSVYPRRRGRVSPEGVSFEAEAVLAAADGTRSMDELAAACGLTRLETGHALAPLVVAGLVEVGHERAPRDDESPASPGPGAHAGASPAAPEGHVQAVGGADGSDLAGLTDDGRTTAVLEHGSTGRSADDDSTPAAGVPVSHLTSRDPVDGGALGPRLAPDVIAANEHVGASVEPSDVEDDLPVWGDPVDSLPDGLHLQPVPVDLPEVVFEPLADGVTNRTTFTPERGPVLEESVLGTPGDSGDQHRAGVVRTGVDVLSADEPAAVIVAGSAVSVEAPDEDARRSAADEAERIAADEAVRVQAEEDADERTARQAALRHARVALDAARAEAERAAAACEELMTTRVRAEATVSRLARQVAASDDELSRSGTEARTSAERAEQGAADEEQARAEVAAAEAAVSRAAAALQAAREAQEAAVSRLVATGASRADLYERAASAQDHHRDAAERSARLKAEERLARDDAEVSVRAHAAAEAHAAAARASVAGAARRLEVARSRLSELD